MKPSTEWWRYLAPLAVIAIIALLPVPAGLENHTWLYFAVFTGVIVGLILEPVPGAVVAMVGISIIAILSPWLLFSPEQLAQPGFKFTAKSLSWAVSGFSNSVIWLIFAAFMFGTGYEKTGLGRRIALILVKKMGHRTLFLGYAVMFSELILAPVTPSNSARGAGIIYPIIRNLPPLYQSQPNDSSSRSIGSYIMWMGIVADCVTSAIFLTAMAPNLLLIGLMKSASHATLSWGDWFLEMLPLSILLVGATVGRSLAFAWDVPAIPVHHMEGHLLAPMLEDNPPEFPFVALLVSGGHTQLISVTGIGQYELLGESIDDAAGEAFDKTAKLLGLDYPGGPLLSKMAAQGTAGRFVFPRPMTDRPGLDFSFSGLKTFAANTIRDNGTDDQTRADIARAFEDAVVDTLMIKCKRALDQTGFKRLVMAGGVSANRTLRAKLAEMMKKRRGEVFYARPEFCTDNGAMIAYAGMVRFKAGATADLGVSVRPRWPLAELPAA